MREDRLSALSLRGSKEEMRKADGRDVPWRDCCGSRIEERRKGNE